MAVEIVTGQAAYQNLAELPAFLLLYGMPGTLKTTDAVSAFCKDGKCSAFVIPCEDGALKPILARGLPVPDHPKQPVKSWQQMAETIAWLGQNRHKYNALIIDTISTWCNYAYNELEEQHKGSRNKFMIPVEMRNRLYNIREWCRMIGLHVIMIGHSMAPEVKEGVFYRGGPLLTPRTVIEQYFGLIDTVLRVDYASIPTVNNGKPTRVYWTGGTSFPEQLGSLFQPPPDWQFWRTKNREGVADAVVPADLLAFLRRRQPPYAL